MVKKVIELPSFLMYTLPDGVLRRKGVFAKEFFPLSGPCECVEDLDRTSQGIVFRLPDGRYAVYSKDVFKLGLTFPCPYCRRPIEFDALIDYLNTREGIKKIVRLIETVFEEVSRHV